MHIFYDSGALESNRGPKSSKIDPGGILFTLAIRIFPLIIQGFRIFTLIIHAFRIFGLRKKTSLKTS